MIGNKEWLQDPSIVTGVVPPNLELPEGCFRCDPVDGKPHAATLTLEEINRIQQVRVELTGKYLISRLSKAEDHAVYQAMPVNSEIQTSGFEAIKRVLYPPQPSKVGR